MDGPAVTRLQALKTGRLIQFSAEAGAILGRATVPQRHLLAAYGRDLGVAFQIADDLLDAEGSTEETGKTAGKDAAAGKATMVAVLGRTGAGAGRAAGRQAAGILMAFGNAGETLRALASFVVTAKLIGREDKHEFCEHAVAGPRPLSGGPAQLLPRAIAPACRRAAGRDDRRGVGHRRASGRSLGVVELTVAIHAIFDTPHDRLIWDVGHQAYPHKILTGRRDRIRTLRQGGGLSGFTRRAESEYDPFGAAHSSTSISAGLGMAVARDLKNHSGQARTASGSATSAT